MANLKVAICAIGLIICTYTTTAFGAFQDIGVGAPSSWAGRGVRRTCR